MPLILPNDKLLANEFLLFCFIYQFATSSCKLYFELDRNWFFIALHIGTPQLIVYIRNVTHWISFTLFTFPFQNKNVSELCQMASEQIFGIEIVYVCWVESAINLFRNWAPFDCLNDQLNGKSSTTKNDWVIQFIQQ